MKYHFIYNPIAGNGSSKKAWATIQDFLKSIDFKYEVHETKGEGHATKIAMELSQLHTDITIISVGGDGTLSEVVNGIVDFNKVRLSMIPCGSGNDFSKVTNLPQDDIIEVLKYILTHEPRLINFMIINGKKRAINVCGFGLDTEVLKKYYSMKHFSQKFKYKWATLVSTLFFKWHASEVKVDDGEWKKVETLLLTICNGQTIGGGINMCPTAKIDDNWLDFTYVNHFPRIKTIPYLLKVLHGKILGIKETSSCKCHKVEIKLPNKTYQYDGFIVSDEDVLKIEIAKESIKFIG